MTVNSTLVVLDGNAALQTLAAQLQSGVLWPANLAVALVGDVPTPLISDAAGHLLTLGVLPPSGRIPVADSFTATGRSGTFLPIAGRGFNITVGGTFEGTVQLQRSFDNGATWFRLTGGGYPIYTWTAEASETAVEYEDGVLYSLECTAFTSGALEYRISQ